MLLGFISFYPTYKLQTAPLNDHLFMVLTYTTTPDKRISASPEEKSNHSKCVGTKEAMAL